MKSFNGQIAQEAEGSNSGQLINDQHETKAEKNSGGLRIKTVTNRRINDIDAQASPRARASPRAFSGQKAQASPRTLTSPRGQASPRAQTSTGTASPAREASPRGPDSPNGPEAGYLGTLRMEGVPPIVIRHARPSDVEEMISFAQPAYTRDPLRADLVAGTNLTEVQKTEYNKCKAMLLSLFDGFRVILLYKQSKTAAYFGMFAVHPFFQKTGLGKRLLTIAESYARITWGSDEMYLDVAGSLEELRDGMGRLQRYYMRRGFRSSGNRRPFRGQVARFITVDRDDLWIEEMIKDITGAEEKRMERVNSRGKLTKEADKMEENKEKKEEKEEKEAEHKEGIEKKTMEKGKAKMDNEDEEKKRAEEAYQTSIKELESVLLEKHTH
uniref:N-acetyltransferase domain-containing protein n=1 Tax=Globodera rostochiensis TaxID=31243 RepID=A0A914HND4_GLORO